MKCIVAAFVAVCCGGHSALAQDRAVPWVRVAHAVQQGAQRPFRENTVELTAGVRLQRRESPVNFGLEWGYAKFGGRALNSTAGPINAGDATTMWGMATMYIASARSRVTPVISAGLGGARVRSSSDPEAGRSPVVSVGFAFRARGRRLFGELGIGQRVFLTTRAAFSDSDLLRHYSLGATLGWSM